MTSEHRERGHTRDSAGIWSAVAACQPLVTRCSANVDHVVFLRRYSGSDLRNSGQVRQENKGQEDRRTTIVALLRFIFLSVIFLSDAFLHDFQKGLFDRYSAGCGSFEFRRWLAGEARVRNFKNPDSILHLV